MNLFLSLSIVTHLSFLGATWNTYTLCFFLEIQYPKRKPCLWKSCHSQLWRSFENLCEITFYFKAWVINLIILVYLGLWGITKKVFIWSMNFNTKAKKLMSWRTFFPNSWRIKVRKNNKEETSQRRRKYTREISPSSRKNEGYSNHHHDIFTYPYLGDPIDMDIV